MPSIKKVANYGNFSIHDALDLPCDMFLLMLKNATIDDLMQTEEGRDYLAKCERLNNTSIDIDGLTETFGGGK
ncbi:MAG: hypothetical protein [Bacteriophage sp.]|nr:MAG: hypothetical protein [Bacteriophage sp.]